MQEPEMIQLQNINRGVGNTRLEKGRYEIYRQAILQAVPTTVTGILFKDLPAAVREHLPIEKLAQLGSVSWHVTTVKLDLEARGLIERIPGSKPQRLRRQQGTCQQGT